MGCPSASSIIVDVVTIFSPLLTLVVSDSMMLMELWSTDRSDLELL